MQRKLGMLVPLALWGCGDFAPPHTQMRQQALREGDAGAQATLTGPAHLSRIVRNAADYRRWQADLARRGGETTRATTLEREADALDGVALFAPRSGDDYAQVHGLLPRTRFRKPDSPLRCEQLRGPNVIRFKLRDRSGVALQDGRLVAGTEERASRLTADLATIEGLGLRQIPAHTASRDVLDRVRLAGELASGQELPDVTQWFEAFAGPRAVAEVRDDREACERAADVVNTLNGLESVEIAYFAPTIQPAQTWNVPPPPVDIAPTTPVFESASMGIQTPTGGPVGAVVGLNSPEVLGNPGEIAGPLQNGWQGATIRIVVAENAEPLSHEKVAYFLVPGMVPDNANLNYREHALMVSSVAFGSSRSGGPFGSRYGMRGHAPQALGGYHSTDDVTLGVRMTRPGMAIEQIAPYVGNGDVINFSIGLGVLAWSSERPVETDQDANDKMHLFGANGVVFINAAGNSGSNLDQHGFPPKPPTSYIVGATTGQLVAPGGGPNRIVPAPYSNWGPRVNFWGPALRRYPNALTIPTLRMPVVASRTFDINDSLWTPSDPVQEYRFIDGTSLSAPEISGAFAQMQGLFRSNFGWRLGTGDGPHGTRQIAEALRSIGVPLDQGVQPNLQLVATERMLAVRVTGCELNTPPFPVVRQVLPPYAREVSVVAPAGVQFSSMLNHSPPYTGCLMNFPTGGASPVEVYEANRGFPIGPLDLDGPAMNGFTVEAWMLVGGPTAAWQQIVAKESPRNYGIWITPTNGPVAAGRLHFSYFYHGGINCARYGTRNVADGQPHHVAVVFDADPWPPQVRFYVDGVQDGPTQAACNGFPMTGGGPGENRVEIGRDVAAGTQIGDVRLYHYPASAARIALHHGRVQ